MRKWKKRSLRDEYRKNHKVAPRREIGRHPNGVFQELWSAMRSVDEELKLEHEVNDAIWTSQPMVESAETQDFFEKDKVYREQAKNKPQLADALKGQFWCKVVYVHPSTHKLYAHGLWRSGANRPWNPYPVNLLLTNWSDGWDEIELSTEENQ